MMMPSDSLEPRDPALAPEVAPRTPAPEAEDREVVLALPASPALWESIDAQASRMRAMTAPAGFTDRVLARLADR